MRTRKLTLNKETLVELSTDELDSVAGGAVSGPSCPACSGLECLTDRCFTRNACFTTDGCG